jgi:hypothetical protein
MMSTKQEDFIILASNVKSYGDTNTISNFRTKLARRRDFPSNEDWRVALTEITYKQSWYNVKESIVPKYYTRQADDIKSLYNPSAEIPPGFYTIESLISEINNLITKLVTIENIPPSFMYNSHTQMVSLTPGLLKTGVMYIPILGKEIEKMLGFVDEKNNGLY